MTTCNIHLLSLDLISPDKPVLPYHLKCTLWPHWPTTILCEVEGPAMCILLRINWGSENQYLQGTRGDESPEEETTMYYSSSLPQIPHSNPTQGTWITSLPSESSCCAVMRKTTLLQMKKHLVLHYVLCSQASTITCCSQYYFIVN